MKALQGLFEQDWLLGVFYSIIVLGIALFVWGAWAAISAEVGLRDNPAYQMRNQEIELESSLDINPLFAADQERRELEIQRWDGIMRGGAGLVLLSVGWMLLNVANDRRSNLSQSVIREGGG